MLTQRLLSCASRFGDEAVVCIYKGTTRFSQHHGPISEGLREESDHDLPEAIGGDFVLAVVTLKHPPTQEELCMIGIA